jgi:hypothetical protein
MQALLVRVFPRCTPVLVFQVVFEIMLYLYVHNTTALRCDGESCQHRRHHSILQFQLESDVCSANLHHNPRKHVGLHVHQRLHRLP